MAMKARYTVVNGEVIAQKRAGARHLYTPDPLGSTVALINSSQTKTDTWSYWPYGEVKTRTGSTATPFQFVGTLGYYRDTSGRTYVRARSLRLEMARWQEQDPIGWTEGAASVYHYVHDNPVTFIDPSGTKSVRPEDPRWPKPPDYPLFTIGGLPMPPLLTWGEIGCVQRAYAAAVAAQRRLDPKRFPPGNGGPRDAFRHCVGACLARRTCGENAYWHGIIDHEINGAYWAKGCWDPKFSPMDLANDAEGYDCFNRSKGSPRTCEACCLDKLNADDLYILPRNDWE